MSLTLVLGKDSQAKRFGTSEVEIFLTVTKGAAAGPRPPRAAGPRTGGPRPVGGPLTGGPRAEGGPLMDGPRAVGAGGAAPLAGAGGGPREGGAYGTPLPKGA